MIDGRCVTLSASSVASPAHVDRTVPTLRGTDTGPPHVSRPPLLPIPMPDRPLRSAAPTNEHDDATTDQAGPSRRRVAQAAGWSVPLAIAAVGAPSAHASTTPPPPFDRLTGTWSTPELTQFGLTQAVFTITNTSQETQVFSAVRFVYSTRDDRRSLIVGVDNGGGESQAFNLSGSGKPNAVETYGFSPLDAGQSLRFLCIMNRSGDSATIAVTASDSSAQTSFAAVFMPDGR